MIERKSRLVRITKLPRKGLLKPIRRSSTGSRSVQPEVGRPLTLDNGIEYANHEQLSASFVIKCYFVYPSVSWERGTNENINGLIR